MKNLLKIAATLLLVIAFTQNSKAQFKFNAGAEVGFALADGLGFIYGPALGGEIAMGDKTGITIESGYNFVSNDGGGTVTSIPMSGGFKYYFDSNEGGLFLHGQIGYTITSVSFGGGSINEAGLSYATGLGVLINDKISIGGDFNIATGNFDYNYIAVRAAYQF